MITYGWGKLPQIQANVKSYSPDHFKRLVKQSLIPRGHGLSYGDSALAENILDMRLQNSILGFDQNTGVLQAGAGTSLARIVEHCLPYGWLPQSLPGSLEVSLGGAIASDVHGKDHIHKGSFSEGLIEFDILTPCCERKTICRESNPDYFLATCGGMGLTGPILSAKIQLKAVGSRNIIKSTYISANLRDSIQILETNQDSEYSVAWIDCLAKGKSLGRGVIELGQHAQDNELKPNTRRAKLRVPISLPVTPINTISIKAFNQLYIQRAKVAARAQQKVDIEAFMFPLDRISQWNNIYGDAGFLQYQFLLAKKNAAQGISQILEHIHRSKEVASLGVLKALGPKNQNLLSFADEGYTLAIDFKYKKTTRAFLNELDKIVLQYQGRFYLAKDARLKKETFELGYPSINKFRAFRKNNNLTQHFASLQSQRLKL